MQILNLIRLEKSDISYEIFHFPDGEVHIKLGEINRKETLKVICRITNAEELFIVMQIGDILSRQEVEWELHITYLMSMRMDRVISFNESFSLKVVLNALNSLNPYSIIIYHPHSDVYTRFGNSIWSSHECLQNLEVFNYDDFQLCFPDSGAESRYRKLYHLGYNPLIGEKIRNTETGKIESIRILNPQDYLNRPILVLDDLCDGGGTFCGIASAIREFYLDVVINIQVFHMVNRKGIENLSKYFNKVVFTNSYKDWDNLPSNCKMIEII